MIPKPLRIAPLATGILALALANSAQAVSTLYGVTGDGASTSETLFTLDKATGAPTFVKTLGAGGGGETIAFNPDDGDLYHWSETVMEKIDLAGLGITGIPLSGDGFFEMTSATYGGGGKFFLGERGAKFYEVTTSGAVTLVGSMDHTSKGLAFLGGDLYSVDRSSDLLRTVSPVTGATISSLGITLAGHTVFGANGLATDPDTGTLYALLRVSGLAGRALVTIDHSTGVATLKGSTGDAFAGLAFAADAVATPDAGSTCVLLFVALLAMSLGRLRAV